MSRHSKLSLAPLLVAGALCFAPALALAQAQQPPAKTDQSTPPSAGMGSGMSGGMSDMGNEMSGGISDMGKKMGGMPAASGSAQGPQGMKKGCCKRKGGAHGMHSRMATPPTSNTKTPASKTSAPPMTPE